MDMQTALAHFGVDETTLSAEEKAFLDQNGYLPLPNLLSPEQVQALATRLEELAAAEGDKAGLEAHQEVGTTRLANIVDKGAIFEVCFTHPRILAAMAHVLQKDFKLSSLNARFALPGEGLQHLHADWRGGVPPGEFEVCNSIWLLDDFTPENGATRVVPGSHNWGKTPREVMDDPKATHPVEILLTAPAGTVVIFNSHTWHGGTLNRTTKPRRAMHSYFTRRHNPQQTDQRKYLSPETVARLGDEAKFILDVL
jgi:ectoine hydroxylase-related dioxygenase (phytanoyl-CoA dioxygenase family)